MTAPVMLDAVLERLQLPLAQVTALKPGMTLAVPTAAINRTELVAARGYVVARVRLGQVNGFRAVRLVTGEEGHQTPVEPTHAKDAGSPRSTSDMTADRPSLADLDAQADRPSPPVSSTGLAGADRVLNQSDASSELPDLLGGALDTPDAPGLAGEEVSPTLDLPEVDDLPALPVSADGDLPELPDLPGL